MMTYGIKDTGIVTAVTMDFSTALSNMCQHQCPYENLL